jgi:energy-coupling factor transporter ATP-binding protein EcfA2
MRALSCLSSLSPLSPLSHTHTHTRTGPFKDFTAVIGPNGSGKSNLMDAISFVLGVRTNQLRGAQLRELLYSNSEGTGEEDRPTRGLVKLVYMTEAGEEVAFSRHVQPAGEGPGAQFHSVYKINGRTVTWDAYSTRLSSHGILVKVRNFLVFQVRRVWCGPCVRPRGVWQRTHLAAWAYNGPKPRRRTDPCACAMRVRSILHPPVHYRATSRPSPPSRRWSSRTCLSRSPALTRTSASTTSWRRRRRRCAWGCMGPRTRAVPCCAVLYLGQPGSRAEPPTGWLEAHVRLLVCADTRACCPDVAPTYSAFLILLLLPLPLLCCCFRFRCRCSAAASAALLPLLLPLLYCR